MTLKLYYFPLSQPSRTVLAFLILNEIPFEKIVIDILKGQQQSPEYLKINPLGLVPAIDDNGFLLNESEAIIRYLINTRSTKEKYYPKDPEQRALIDRYLPFHHSSAGYNTVRYFKASHPELYPGIPYTLEEVKPELLAAYERFEKHYLKDNKYIAGGDDITIADLFAVNDFSQIYYTTSFDYSKFPKLKAYIERVLENPVMKELNAPIKQFGEAAKNKLVPAPAADNKTVPVPSPKSNKPIKFGSKLKKFFLSL